LAKFCSILLTNIINKLYFYKYYVFLTYPYLPPPRTAAAAREADAVALYWQQALNLNRSTIPITFGMF
jgi:hypothetical protein